MLIGGRNPGGWDQMKAVKGPMVGAGIAEVARQDDMPGERSRVAATLRTRKARAKEVGSQ